MLFIVFFFMCGLFFPYAKALAEEMCFSCHRKILDGKNVHPPVAQSCMNCHEAVGPHPLSKKARRGMKFVQDPPGLCEMCHAAFGKKAHIHPPVRDGKCTACHRPHASDQVKLLIKTDKGLCLTCHQDKVNFTFLHSPVAEGNCTSCHFPHESDHKALLVKDVNELCFTCHVGMKDVMKKKGLHPALLAGCTSCHNPHGAPHKKLLAVEGDTLCIQCHPQIGEKVEKAKVTHAPIKTEKGCASCHSPHATDNAKLLVKQGKDLCLGCHKNIIKRNMTVLHGPISNGSCAACHEPHGSQNNKLLLMQFSTELYVPYSDNEYALCFSCHNRELLQDLNTSSATGFRDGQKNLHFVHVNREKGRYCGLCHSIHGSSQQKLVADVVTFGKWSLPLSFIKTDTGGSCTPGCHKTYNYDRQTPGKAPTTQKPTTEQQKKRR